MAAAAAAADDAKLESCLQWLQANGVDLRGCTIRACGGGKGFGVFSTAAEPGATDGVAMVVPLDLAVTAMRVLQDPLVGPRCRALFEEGGVDDRLLLMLFLMAERLRPSSLWKPYLDMLPSTFWSSPWFTEEELEELQGTTLYRATVMQRKSLQTLFTDKVKGLVEELLRVDEPESSIEVSFEDFLWANSIFWTRALNIPLPGSYVFPGPTDDQLTKTDDSSCNSSLAAHQENHITAKNSSVDGNSESSNPESIWVEGLVPGIDFCNHNVKAMATWEVDSVGNATGVPASMYLMLADKSSVEAGAEIYINYGNKGNEELLYLYGFVLDNNPDDYLMVHYPVEALRQVQCADIKMKLLEIQNGELRCLLPRSLLDNGFFGICSDEEKDTKKNSKEDKISSSFSWSGQRSLPSYLHKMIFPQEFISTLRTVAMQEHEIEQVASLLGEVGSSEDREPSDAEVQSAIWEVCGDHGSLSLLVDLLRVKMTELEEGTGTEASDSQLLETFYSIDSEDSISRNDENSRNKSKTNTRSCIVYRRGQKELTRLFLREAEYLLELSAKEET